MYTYEIGYWETKDHKKMKIQDMETSHIKNTIRYLKKNTDFYDIASGVFYDPSTYYYEDNSHLVYKKVEELENELNRRGENNE